MTSTPFQLRSLANSAIKNVIINGNFDFWQRGTSYAAIANGAYLADRFKHSKTGSMVYTAARSTDVPTYTQSGFASTYAALFTNTTAQSSLGATDFASLRYVVEGYDYAPVHGKNIRFQFWVKSSIAGVYSFSLRNSAADRSYVTTYTIDSANTWEKKTIDLTLDNTGTWLYDTGIGLICDFILGSGTTYQTSTLDAWQAGLYLAASTGTNHAGTLSATFQVAQVALMPGNFSENSDTSFVRAGKNIQEELTFCQRYYEKSYDLDITPGTSVVGSGAGVKRFNTNGVATLQDSVEYKVTKRSTPTAAVYSQAGTVNFVTNITDTTEAVASTSLPGQSAHRTVIAGTDNKVFGYCWTSDAEL